LEINLNDEEFYNMLIGKKRKRIKNKENDKEEGTSDEEGQEIKEEESTLIFGIKNDENSKDSLNSKNSEISNSKKKTNKISFIESKYNSGNINDNNDISNNNEVDKNNNSGSPNIIKNQENRNNNDLINKK